MENLDFQLQIKSIDETGSLEGYAAVYNVEDRGGDVVLPGAFTRTLTETSGRVPLLWQHDQRSPIGLAHLSDHPGKGLFLRGQLDLDVQEGRRAYSALSKRIVTGLSFGYLVVKSFKKQGVRQLQELKLLEVSAVSVPMNDAARIVSVKDADHGVSLGEAGILETLGEFQVLTALLNTKMAARRLQESMRARTR